MAKKGEITSTKIYKGLKSANRCEIDARRQPRRGLTPLWVSLQVDDVLVQKKALAEVKAVFQAASLIGRCGHAPSV